MARRRLGVAALALIGIAGSAELVGVYPHTLTFFNQLVGGPANGYRYLADSNLGWGQNLKGLKTWMATNGVSHVNIAYFGQADPAYYGIDCTHLPGAPSFAMDATARPRLPGYVAISSTTLSGVYLAPEWRLFYRPFLSLDPVAVIGNSIRVYWVEQWPDVVGGLTAEAGANAHRRLADALLFGLQWPELATSVYPAYLARIPADADAWVNYGMTLVAVNRVREGMDSLQRAVATDGGHGRARLMLARALFGSRDMAGAVLHAEQAVALLPADADAHHFLGRVRAALGDLVDAHREFTRALEIQPLHPEALRDLARVVREAGGHVGDDDVGKGGA